MRINNYISSVGICSRRKADELITQGKVKINGKTAVIGQVVNPGDRVEVNGEYVKPYKNFVYIAFNKPVGVICTTERHVKNNIIDFINHPERIFPIGRLDRDSEGLILLTGDGSIVNEILRDKNNYEKEYIVTVDKEITPDFIQKMSKGVRIFNPVKNTFTRTKPCKVVKLDSYVFKIVLTQGLNRQIRRMCASFDYKVVKLRRIRIMDIGLKNLPPGKWRNLTESEVQSLLATRKSDDN
jgi:23S rRNA pseudouridine2604 synthase